MNFPSSTQYRTWTYNTPELTENEHRVISECIWFIHDVQTNSELGPQRKAFVTAAHYIHRYFSKVKIEDVASPSLVALTCLFLSGKTEEIRWPFYVHGSLQNRGFTAKRLCEHLNECQIEDLIQCEQEILTVLDFNLVVHQTIPRPKANSLEELKETALLMYTRCCLDKTPIEFGKLIEKIQIKISNQGIPELVL